MGDRAHVQQPLPLLQPGESEEPCLPGHLSGLQHPGSGTEVSSAVPGNVGRRPGRRPTTLEAVRILRRQGKRHPRHMFRYLVRRLLWAILLFIVITFVTFVIFFIAPNNPARGYCGGENAKPAVPRSWRRRSSTSTTRCRSSTSISSSRLVVDRSLGQSYFTGQDVNEAIAQAAPVTASLVFGGASPLDDDRPRGRGLLGPETTLADRPSRDGVRPDRRVRAPGLDRSDLLLLLRLQAGDNADRELRELLRRALGLRACPAAPGSGSTT